ncbi:hypothetical protein [Kitasatospora sp. NPDC047058]|uniref:hypothetical protein n=1 Tax=Kitasatospora sp. NPDC047058 TaxID=3155620 RepID=UPI0033C54EA9
MTTGKLSQALTRRGFTTRRLRLRAAAVIVAITAGVSGVLLYDLTNALGPDTVCGGAASADGVHGALGPGRISEERTDGWSPSAVDRSGHCTATVSFGLFGQSERSVSFETASEQTETAPRTPVDARLFSGDTAGAVTSSGAWALLPDGCPKGLRAVVGVGGDGPDGDRVAGLARLAAGYAGRVAKDRGCGTGTQATPTGLSPAGTAQPVDFTKVCGVPGLAPARSEEVRDELRQQATTAFAPVWRCEITSTWSGQVVASFGITTDPRATGLSPDGSRTPAYGRASWIGPAGENVVATCQGKPTYFHLESNLLSSAPRSKVFPDDQELWKQFLTAGGKAVGCEPIVP